VFPFLLWGGFRFNQRVVATLTFMIAAIGVQATLAGNGPFVWNGVISSLLGLLPFLGILSTSALLFTAVVSDQRRSQQNLARAIQSRDDLLAVVSHDLKNPLSSVLLNLEFLSRSAEKLPLDKFTDKIEKIKVVAKNMQTLIVNALDTALNDGQNNIPIVPCEDSAKAIVDECVEMLKPLAEAKSITLKTILNFGRIKLRCDHEKIIRVLSNLVGNAIKFTPSGGNIVISVEQKCGKGLFAVRDTGKGIDSKEIPHLFDRFWQMRKKNKEGTGLGLSIAKRIVEAHQGEIWVKSMPGVGTIFYFTLPLEG
jgi:signal transduction histidine kinase